MTDEEQAKGGKFRARLKIRFYRVLFGQNKGRTRFRNLLKERFRHHHPTMAKMLVELKRRNYRHSSHVLQNFEATVFIYRICGRIMREQPGCFVATLHDGLLTAPENAKYVTEVIRDEFAKLGVTPTLKQEPCG